MSYFLGIDLGSTSIKAVVYDLAGNAKEWVSDWHNYDYYKVSPRRNSNGRSQKIPPFGDLEALKLARGEEIELGFDPGRLHLGEER